MHNVGKRMNVHTYLSCWTWLMMRLTHTNSSRAAQLEYSLKSFSNFASFTRGIDLCGAHITVASIILAPLVRNRGLNFRACSIMSSSICFLLFLQLNHHNNEVKCFCWVFSSSFLLSKRVDLIILDLHLCDLLAISIFIMKKSKSHG